jgi:hypothetical protein
LSKNFTKDTVALLHHVLDVLPLESGRDAVLPFPPAWAKNCPGVISSIGLPQSMLLLNKIALYHKAAGGVFEEESLSLPEKWYRSHCNAALLKAQCSFLGLETTGNKDVLSHVGLLPRCGDAGPRICGLLSRLPWYICVLLA